eukprot:scaffold3999_cov196-Ochromonas_danica.AAC.9
MVSRSILLQLPRDILHSVYSDWLASWRDLSCLDVGCVAKEDRETWLCSFCELKMKSGLENLCDQAISGWYEWVFSRKVLLVEKFSVKLSGLVNLAAELDYSSYCPALRSIEILNDLADAAAAADDYDDDDDDDDDDNADCPLDSGTLSVLEQRLYMFLAACIHLEGVKYIVSVEGSEVNDLVFLALRNALQTNTLQSMHLVIYSGVNICTPNIIREILANHLSSMRDLELCPSQTVSEESVDEIMSILHEKTTPLKRLCLSDVSLQKLSRWLSSVAMHLEELEIGNYVIVNIEEFQKGDILSYVGGACPRLRSLRLGICEMVKNGSKEFPMSKLLQLYELCPHLITFTCHDPISQALICIEVIEDRSELYYDARVFSLSMEEKAKFLDCIYLAMQRSPCKLSLSNVHFCSNLIEHYDEWVLFKSKLSSYLTSLAGVVSESILVEALKELPRLDKVDIKSERYCDLSLSALMEYGYDLKTLYIYSLRYMNIPDQCRFSDDMMSKMIESCQMLEILKIPCAGCKSVLAVKHHPKLKEVFLNSVLLAKDEIESILLGDEREGGEEQKFVWKLHNGGIYGQGFKYLFQMKTKSWEYSIFSPTSR